MPPDQEDSEEQPSRVPWRLAAGLGIVAVLSSVYLALKPPEFPKSGLSFEPTAEERLKVDQLRSQIRPDRPKFEASEVRRPANARLFTYMLATSEDPMVIEAALEAVQLAYSSRSESKALPDADLEKVLLEHVNSPEPRLQSAALSALRIPLMTELPSLELSRALSAELGSTSSNEKKVALLDTLNLLRPNRRPVEVTSAFEQAMMDGAPFVASTALLALIGSAESLARMTPTDRNKLGQKVVLLTESPDPGVRGRALHLLSSVDGLLPADELIRSAKGLLAHADGYVRAEAALALAKRKNMDLIPGLIALAPDLSAARYEIRGWKRLDGSEGVIVHEIPGQTRVGEVALFALRDLAKSLALKGSHEFKLLLSARSMTEAEQTENAKRADSWWTEVNAQPTPSATPSAVR
jgi:hypothetical protein